MSKLDNAKEKLKTKFNEIENLIIAHNEISIDIQKKILNLLHTLKIKQENSVLKLGVVGEFSTGKSTFINFLLGQEILAVSDKPTTPIPAIIKYSHKKRYLIKPRQGNEKEISKEEFFNYSNSNDDDLLNKIEFLIMEYPIELLKKYNMEIVDTPGVNSNNPHHTERTAKIIPTLHAAIFLINAKKPGSKSTIDFINSVQEHINKFFWCITKTNTITEKNVERILEKLPEIIERQNKIKVENLFGLGFNRNANDKKLVGIETFFQILEKFMVEEWENLLAFEIIELFEKEKLSLKENFKTDLVKMEEVFFKTYGEEPISFFEASDEAINSLKANIPELLKNVSSQALSFVNSENNQIKNKYFEKINDAWFKTTLGLKTQDLPKDMKNLQKKLCDNLESFLTKFYNVISEKFSQNIKTKLSDWENFKEKIYSEIAKYKFKRIKYTIVPNLIFSLILLLICHLINSPEEYDLKYVTFLSSCFAISFVILFFITLFIKGYSIFFIRIIEEKNFELRKFTNFYNFLTNKDLSNLGSSQIFIDKIRKNLTLGGIGAGVAIRNDEPILAIASVAISFIANEFSGESLDSQKSKIKNQINENCENFLMAYDKTFNNLETPMKQSLDIMNDMIQTKYKEIIMKDLTERKKLYLLARKPIDKLEFFVLEFEKTIEKK